MKFKNCIFVSMLLLLYGCASTNADVTVQTTDEIKPLKVLEFTLGPGDKINVKVWRHNDLNKEMKVDPYGNVYYSLIGKINVSGMSIQQLREEIEEGLSEYYVDPVVNVEVNSVQSQKVFVLGEVKKPGAFSLDKPINVIEAVARSGGFTIDAKEESVLVIRGDKTSPELIKLDLKSAFKEGALHQNIALQNGDVVYIPATYIANVSRYFKHLDTILSPILRLEQIIVLEPGVEQVLKGEVDSGGGNTIILER